MLRILALILFVTAALMYARKGEWFLVAMWSAGAFFWLKGELEDYKAIKKMKEHSEKAFENIKRNQGH